MTKRNCRFEMRLTKDEYYDLTKKARKAGLTVAGFVRKAVNNAEVKEGPSADVPVLIREVRRVGYNINEILKIARTKGFVDVPRLTDAINETAAIEEKIMEAYS